MEPLPVMKLLPYILIPLLSTVIAYYTILDRIALLLGLQGRDIHKPYTVFVKETGGIGIYIGITALLLVDYLFGNPHAFYLLLTATTLFIVGLIDDLLRLDGLTKVALTSIASIPLLLDNHVYYTILLPFIGLTKLTIIYPVLILIAITVSSNMFNMADTLNGTMLIASIFTVLAILAGIIYNGRSEYAPLLLGLLAVLGYAFSNNIYPAKYFNGDTGSLTIGGLLAALALVTKTETIFLLATLPLVFNGFQILSTIKGFREKSTIPRPVLVRKGCLYASLSEKRETPPTLIQFLLLRGCLKEYEAIAAFTFIMLVSFLVAILLTPILIPPVTLNDTMPP